MVGPPHGNNSFGTSVVNPRIHTDDYQLVPLFAALKPFEPELEKLQQEEQSRRNSASSNGAEKDGDGSELAMMERNSQNKYIKMEDTNKKSASDLPVELWDIIFKFVVPHSDDDSYQSLGPLFNCALTCRAWAYIALPVLYRTHGYGVFMPRPSTRDPGPSRFPASRSINFYWGTAVKRVHQLWRTLLLSCFTVSRPNSDSRFTTFTGATLFPYVKYVHRLDARTLVMVLSEIMKTRNPSADPLDSLGHSHASSSSNSTAAANYFFAGALGAFEISGATRGARFVVGGPEFESIQTPVWGKEIKLFVGDTALMMMDFLYPHLHHLRGFTIAELGQLRVSPPVTMAHPASLLTCLSHLNSLVISSGWMVSAGLGRAIASIRPTLADSSLASSSFNLTILDWRFKTHYDPNYHHNEDWEADHEDYRYTVRSAADFFDALNPNSVTSLDLDFEVRYSRQQQGDLGDGAIAVRQSRSLDAFRVAHLRCDLARLVRMFYRMREAGFAPKALGLVELYREDASNHGTAPHALDEALGWASVAEMFGRLEDLELVRFPDMFQLANEAVLRPSAATTTTATTATATAATAPRPPPPPIRSLNLSYTRDHIRDTSSALNLHLLLVDCLPRLADTLTTLKLCDTEHSFIAQTEPVARAAAIYNRTGPPANGLFRRDYEKPSPLEGLVNLRVLVLTGDVALLLVRHRLRQILHALRNSLTICDLCLTPSHLEAKLSAFLVCERLTHLYLREWNWDNRYSPRLLLHTETVERFVMACKTAAPPPPPVPDRDGNGDDGNDNNGSNKKEPAGELVLKELGIDGGLLEVAARRGWGEVQKWIEARGCRFYWNPHQMWRVGYVAFNGRDPSFV